MSSSEDVFFSLFPAHERRAPDYWRLAVRPLALAAAGFAVFAASGTPAPAQTVTNGGGSVIVDLGVLRQLALPPGAPAMTMGVPLPGAGGRVLLMPGIKPPRSMLHVLAPANMASTATKSTFTPPPAKTRSRLTVAPPAPAAPSSPPPAPAPPAVPVAESPQVVELPPPPPEIEQPKPASASEPAPTPEPPPPPPVAAATPPPPSPSPPAEVAAAPEPPPPPPVAEETPPPPPAEEAAPEPPSAPQTVAEETPPPPAPSPAEVAAAPPPPPSPAEVAAAPEPPAAEQPSPPPAPTEQAVATPPAQALSEGQAMRIEFQGTETKLPASAKTELADLAVLMKAQMDFRLQLHAYAGDESLSAGKARRLSLSRALSVRSFLIEEGIRSTRIDVRALGNKTTKQPINRVDVNVVQR